MDPPYSTRLAKLRKLLRQEQVPALLVTKFVNVTYLTGFTGDDSYLLVTANDAIMLSDFRYVEQLQEECLGLDVEIRRQGMTMLQLVSQAVRRSRVSRLGVEAESLSVGWYRRLEQSLSNVELEATTGLVEQLREIKDRDELDEIRRSIYVAQKAFEVIRAQLRPEQTEKRVAAELEYQIRQFGGSGCSFAPIVAVGPRAALPHAVPTDQRMDRSDFVLIDWGAKAAGYASDLTRILVTGKISAKLERVYGVVLKAQLRAIEAIRPGAPMSDVDAVARTVIAEAGWGKQFGHGLGHGIGLEIHEAPRLAVQLDQPLVAGMVVTVEPGVYLPGWGGVRIEDDVLVTRDGHEVLSDLPKELDGCLVR
jgi:Xaa-Pro aminopeptidase